MDIAKVRLFNQHISGNKCTTPEEVVRSLGAVQAQDYGQALWAIGLRMKHGTVAAVEKATQDRTIIRSWGMRGTLHFILAEDAKWMQQLHAARILAKLTPKVWEYHAATPQMVEQAKEVFSQALRGGKWIKRSEMIELLKKSGIPDDKQQSYFLFAYLCQTGLLCLGPNEGSKQTFALLDEWVPNQRQLTHEEALSVFATRFFTSHGPATVADFSNWGGLTMQVAKTGLELVKSKFIKETVDGIDYWLSAHSTSGSGTFLLPGYDEFLIGYKDRGPSFQKYGAIPIATYNGMFFATIVADGQVAGLWKRTITKAKQTRIDVVLNPITTLNEEKIQQEADRLGAFFGLPVTVTTKKDPQALIALAHRPKWGAKK